MERKRRKVEVVAYKEEWKKIFHEEATNIRELMGELITDIYHIGSTSISNIKAKPIIDIMPIVKDITQVDAFNMKMEALGYKAYGEYGLTGRRYFAKFSDWDENIRFAHVHFYQTDNPGVEQHLLFKDYLLSHLKDALEYSELKESLSEKYPNDIDRYMVGKDLFIKQILSKAGFARTYLREVKTDNEWEQYHIIREAELFKNPDNKYDRMHPSLSDSNNLHYVFYKGADIIGVIQIEQLTSEKVAFRNIAIKGNFKNRGFGSDLIKQAERIAKNKGYKLILLHAAKEAYNFYKRNGFSEMEFKEEVEFNLECIDMGKKI
ncbi:hypothetical protein NF27_DT01780 [Candidatus Jidaibacter acanthamoeba]|uniref:N-acetyltransferase domain-containing protein n=1 Tax=Candidatus Jidaibacter acanthamoebae TaxID=86105 RepID=A0A0C1QIQ5_9RICK|nr:bifunctional GrpB family protein/GNAT family N-acetyltransferase [Candidatus Jidaibacter acanthamoeba]KIE05404.1 hypothetical protein NF27_DT01780 [Candidatus Jidaibacter acanthamoeba]